MKYCARCDSAYLHILGTYADPKWGIITEAHDTCREIITHAKTPRRPQQHAGVPVIDHMNAIYFVAVN